MTPQEASEELKEEFEIFKNSIDPADWKNPNEELKKIIEANTMAIKALETASCIKEKCAYCPHCEHCDVDDETLAIKALEQQPKTGHWISHREHCSSLGVMPSGLGAYEWCSNCDCGIDVMEFHKNHYNYCPNCGADMRGDSE